MVLTGATVRVGVIIQARVVVQPNGVVRLDVLVERLARSGAVASVSTVSRGGVDHLHGHLAWMLQVLLKGLPW